jgi:hypothetical protein
LQKLDGSQIITGDVDECWEESDCNGLAFFQLLLSRTSVCVLPRGGKPLATSG